MVRDRGSTDLIKEKGKEMNAKEEYQIVRFEAALVGASEEDCRDRIGEEEEKR